MVVTPDRIDPAAPTDAACGSEQKILVLAARAEVGLPLFHAKDTPAVIPPGPCQQLRGFKNGRYWFEH
jgi:hypothetical protein